MVVERNIAIALEKLAQVQRILLWDVAKEQKLSPIQIQFLIFIYNNTNRYCTVSCLADEFDLTKATVSDAIKNLEEKGYIIKKQSATDKRSSVLQLTKKGKELFKKVSTWQATILDVIDSFPENKRKQISLLLNELIVKFYDKGIVTTARICTTCDNLQITSGKYMCNYTGKVFTKEKVTFGCDNYHPAQ